MIEDFDAYIGLDVHRDTIAVAVASGGRERPEYLCEFRSGGDVVARLPTRLFRHGRRWRRDGGVGSDMLRDQVGVLVHAVVSALDLNHGGVVQEPVEPRGGHDRVAQHGASLGEALVRGEDHCTLLVAGADELEEQVRTLRVDGDIADLVDDGQGVRR